MKYCFKIILALFLFSNISFSQFYAEDEISPYIIEFMKIVDKTALSRDSLGEVQIEFSDDELNHIAKLYYQAFDEDPVGFHYYIVEEYNKQKQEFIEIGRRSEELLPAVKRRILKNQVTKNYGFKFMEIISTPAFIRGKFISKSRSKYISPNHNNTFPQDNFIFFIEDILKGNKFFNVGDTVTISMIPNAEAYSPSFETGKSCLIPIRPWIGLTEYKGEVTFKWLQDFEGWMMGVPPKTFPIENEIIKNCDYFGINDTSWTDFKKFFKDKYLIFD